MIKITAKDLEYKQWLKRRNERNLKRRTRRKSQEKSKKLSAIAYQDSLKKTYGDKFKRGGVNFVAPGNFSLIGNPDDTVKYFNRVLKFITDSRNYGQRVFFDISGIKSLTIDALMYMLSIVSNMKRRFREKFEFSGNFPANDHVRDLLLESGFSKYVRHSRTQISQSNKKLEIRSGQAIDRETAKKICDFTISEGRVRRVDTRFLYEILMELMANTCEHAYTDTVLLNCWYVFVESDGTSIKYSFLDTGIGIPLTVNRRFREKIDILKITTDSHYIQSALKGEFERSSTKEKKRGKGLPRIYRFFKENKIQGMRVLSGRGAYGFESESTALPSKALRGTLFYWEIDIAQLRRRSSC